VRIGILAIQGDVEAHARSIATVGACAVKVRREKDLDGIDALILPGGESTTIAKGLERQQLYGPLEAFAASGKPLLGTCAGAVLLAREVENYPVRPLGLIDAVAVRNAYGTQVDSFATQADETARGLEDLRCLHPGAPAAQTGRGGRGSRPGRRLARGGAPGERHGYDLPPRADRRPPHPRAAAGLTGPACAIDCLLRGAGRPPLNRFSSAPAGGAASAAASPGEQRPRARGS
jgi:pyridoxal 5'-phosphate synthase glutaminase subunit Pdx2